MSRLQPQETLNITVQYTLDGEFKTESLSPNFIRQARGINFKVFNYLKQETEHSRALCDVTKSQECTTGHMVSDV
jgi:hypothetical protein